jgi:type III restriction enzyme
METYWIEGVNNAGVFGRWAFVELKNVWTMEEEFTAKLEGEFDKLVVAAINNKKNEVA